MFRYFLAFPGTLNVTSFSIVPWPRKRVRTTPHVLEDQQIDGCAKNSHGPFINFTAKVKVTQKKLPLKYFKAASAKHRQKLTTKWKIVQQLNLWSGARLRKSELEKKNNWTNWNEGQFHFRSFVTYNYDRLLVSDWDKVTRVNDRPTDRPI